MTVGVITAALVAKAFDRAEDDAVDAGDRGLRRVLGLLQERFSRAGDAEARTALARLEDATDSPSRVRELAATVDAVADRDGNFRSDLEGLIEEVRREGLNIGSIVQAATGNQNVQLAEVVDSDVHVTYGQPLPGPDRPTG